MGKGSHFAAGALLGALTLTDPRQVGCMATVVDVQTNITSDLDQDEVKDGGLKEHTSSHGNDMDGSADDVKRNPLVDQSTANTQQEHTLPASLAKAVLVGALGRSQSVKDAHDDEGEVMPSDEPESSNAKSDGDSVHNSKPPLTGCVWGSAGCNKGKGKWNSNSATSINSSSVDETQDNDADSPSTSVFAGSATAKIKAHVQEARGGASSTRRTPLTSRRKSRSNVGKGDGAANGQQSDNASHKPPQGFRLAARIVTSPSDGLSYFLDVPEDPNALELDNWMMNIPYTYVECGPTVESKTESFLLQDMVVRHFPHGADMAHWVNLAGGVTIEKSKPDTGDTESEGESYISDDINGHPKLLVALSPIAITVSGNEEETRTFHPGEVILMEDTLGKGHKMRAARDDSDESNILGQDLKVLMVSLPHSVHYTLADLNDYARRKKSRASASSAKVDAPSDPPSPSSYSGAKHSIFGLASRHSSRGRYRDYRSTSLTAHDTKPCPLEYDSAYSSLFTPSYQQRKSRRRRRKNHQIKESAFSSDYPPPPGHSTYDEESALLRFLPSLRRTMLFGIGLSLTSSFVYCVQLLYPPLLAIIGGAAFVIGGALINVLGIRWSYRQWLAVWEEEWRWRREVKRHKEAQREKDEAMSAEGDLDQTSGAKVNEAAKSEDDTDEE
jgi:hypothetical protein